MRPKFPFAHGLSYTEFEYSNLQVDPWQQILVTLTNIGNYSGFEVAQLYLTFPDEADEPPLQLKGFQKVLSLQYSLIWILISKR